jgi:tetratricopeptide (TPR) repeat protein
MKRIVASVFVCLCSVSLGCLSKNQVATVSFETNMQPQKPLSEQYGNIAVMNAQVGGDTGEFDQQKWATMTADLIQYYLEQASEKNNVPIKLVDREHLAKTMGEKDLAAAGVTDNNDEMAAAKVEGAKAILTSKVTIKIDKQVGKKRTIDAVGVIAGAWGGGGAVDTEEVDEEARNITVQSQFQLKDAATNEIIISHNSRPEQSYSKTKSSAFFGSSKTEADMTPRDKVIGDIIEKQAQIFLGKFVPMHISQTVEVTHSSHESSKAGVNALVVDDWDEALAKFKMAISESPDDHESLFGAGVCCEKLNRMDEARKYYKRAQSLDTEEPKYRAAVDRVSQ